MFDAEERAVLARAEKILALAAMAGDPEVDDETPGEPQRPRKVVGQDFRDWSARQARA